jgi:hypothetical protein
MFSFTVSAQELSKWNFSVKKKEVVLTGFYNGTEVLSIKQIDGLMYALGVL